MAKNDYFVIAYRILSYLYECFQAGGSFLHQREYFP